MSDEKKTRKCWQCRKEFKDNGKIFCKDCEDAPREKSTSGTLIIYDKI